MDNQTETMPQTNFSSGGSKFKKFIIPIAIVVVLGVVGGASAYVYTTKYSPEGIVKSMQGKMAETKTMHFLAEIKMSGKTKEKTAPTTNSFLENLGLGSQGKAQNFTADFSAEGDVDGRDEDNSKVALDLTIKSASGLSLPSNFEAKMISIDKVLYLKLGKLTLPGGSLFNLDQLSGQWIKIDPAEVRQQFGTKGMTEETEIEGAGVTEEDIEQIQKLIKKTDFFSVEEKLAKEQVDGAATSHYKVSFNKAEIRKFVIELNKIIRKITKRMSQEQETSEEMPELTEEKLAELDEAVDKLNEGDISLWIDKNRRLRKVAVKYNIPISQEGGTNNFDLMVKFSKFNESVNITAPADAKSIMELFMGLMGGMSGMMGGMDTSAFSGGSSGFSLPTPMPTPTPSPSPSPSVPSPSPNLDEYFKDSDSDGLQDNIEAMYGTNPNNPDTDGDGHSDLEEISKGYNPNGPGKLQGLPSGGFGF